MFIAYITCLFNFYVWAWNFISYHCFCCLIWTVNFNKLFKFCQHLQYIVCSTVVIHVYHSLRQNCNGRLPTTPVSKQTYCSNIGLSEEWNASMIIKKGCLRSHWMKRKEDCNKRKQRENNRAHSTHRVLFFFLFLYITSACEFVKCVHFLSKMYYTSTWTLLRYTL